MDIGFVFYDVGAIVYDEIANDGANRTENLVALGLDAGAILIPFATGLGTASPLLGKVSTPPRPRVMGFA